jgi:hypothetical protein
MKGKTSKILVPEPTVVHSPLKDLKQKHRSSAIFKNEHKNYMEQRK